MRKNTNESWDLELGVILEYNSVFCQIDQKRIYVFKCCLKILLPEVSLL